MIIIVTQCFPPDVGGIENYMGGLAGAAAAAGRRVMVFADGAGPASDAPTLMPRGVDVRRFGGWKPLRRRRKAAALAAALADAAVDRVICDSWKSVETALSARRGRAAPPVWSLAHGMEVPAAPRPSKRRRIIDAFANVARILANSDFTATRLRPFLPADADLRVETPPIPPQPPAAPAARAALRARLHSSTGASGGPLIATLCRLEPRKGVDQVLRAASVLRVAHPGLHVAVAGDGPDRPRLEALSAELQAPALFLGRVTEAEKAALFAEADLFAMPSRMENDSVEGFGIVYLEAGWHGAPSLAGVAGGASSAVTAGETGWLCDGADPQAVTAALAEAVQDPVERARRGAAAAAHARRQIWSERVDAFIGA